MPDDSNYVAAAAAEPPKPEPPRTYCEPHVTDPVFCCALQGPDGWYMAMVHKWPLPGAYVLTIWREPDRTEILYRSTFTTWQGQVLDDDGELLRSFEALLGRAVELTTGSRNGWSMFTRLLTTDEVIDLDTDGELRRCCGPFSFLL